MTAILKWPLVSNRNEQALIGWALLAVLAVWQLNGFYLPALGRLDARLFWAADGLQWLVLPAVLLGRLAHKAGLRPRHYGLASPGENLWPLAWQSLMVFITAGLVFVVARNLSWRVLGPSPGSFQWEQVFPHGLAGVGVQIYAAVSAGLVESIFSIGLPWLLWCSVRQHGSELHFTCAVSAIFALAHWEHGRHIVIAAFFSHFVMCRWFLLWRTLWPVVLGHTMIDLAASF
ncbi:hypothetical protein [Acidovorax sp.]|uniref:hypothetical protein n=1 Tax=Acidovorax sp. TaxID=1872122 RepID=UPI004037C592